MATCMSSTTVCREPVSQTTSCPSSSVCPSAARVLMPCDGRDVACKRVGAGAVDPARAQTGALSCCGGSSGQRPWCHYTSSCPGRHVASRTIRRVSMLTPVTTCRHHLPVGALQEPLSERLTCRAGRDATHHGGRAPGQVEHWHRTCILSVQHQCSPAGGDVRRSRSRCGDGRRVLSHWSLTGHLETPGVAHDSHRSALSILS
jgi:hypothetical protein